METEVLTITHLSIGAAKDKVAALESAGVIVSDSPAKIGVLLLEVRCLSLQYTSLVILTCVRLLFRL